MKLNFFLLLLTFLAAVTLTSAQLPEVCTTYPGYQRCVMVVLVNYSSSQLNLTSPLPDDMNWIIPPPDNILRCSKVEWVRGSGGETIEGSVDYESNHGKVALSWKNSRWSYHNTYEFKCPPEYECQHYGGETGTVSVVVFTFGDRV